MPDGDKINDKLPGPYQEPYEHMCEGQSPVNLVRGFERALRKSLEERGNGPVEILHGVVEESAEVLFSPLFLSQADEKRTLNLIKERARRSVARPRGRNLAIETCKQVLLAEPHRRSTDSQKVLAEACTVYVRKVFDDSCLSPIRQTPEHAEGATRAEVEKRMRAVEQELQPAFEWFGQHLARHGSVDNLRVRPQSQGIEVEGDALKSIMQGNG